MRLSLKKLFSTTVLCLLFAAIGTAGEIIADWPLNYQAGAKVITDSTGRHNLTGQVSETNGVWSGIAEKYAAALDMRDSAWTLEGNFQTAGPHSGIFVIAGNRSELSGYSGWDFLMINGTLRVTAVKERGKSAKVLCSRRFDDGKSHEFVLSWNPADGNRGRINLVIDKKYTYSAPGAGDLGEAATRLFGIGCQAAEAKKILVWNGGSLKNFKLTKGVAEQAASAANIAKLDAEMKTSKSKDKNIKWVDAATLTVEGKGWRETAAPYSRLPLRLNSVVRPPVWALSTHSAGIAIRFTAKNTKFITARWTLKHDCYLPHMTALGASGLDLYVKLKGKWRWAGVGKPSRFNENEAVLKSGIPQDKKFEYLLYLPLYNVTTDLKLGFSPGAQVEPVPERGKPLVVYGTSIVHGCSASRPGMNWPAMLGRRFDLPVVNLGFSGNGTTDPEFADILAEIPASAYLIDCLPNMAKMKSQEICDRTVFLVKKLREKRPDTPIILMEDRSYAYPDMWGSKPNQYRREGLKMAYDLLVKDKVTKLWYVKGDNLVGRDDEATVDGSHPTDLGMYRYCEVLEPVVRQALEAAPAKADSQADNNTSQPFQSKLLDLHARIYPDRFPADATCYLPLSVPRNSSAGFQVALRSRENQICTINLTSPQTAEGVKFTGKVELKPLIPVCVEANTQGSLMSRPGGEAPAAWYNYFVRRAPFQVLEAIGRDPVSTLELVAGKTSGMLLEITVPANTTPGLYRGEFSFKDKDVTVKLPFSFRVHKTVMPEDFSLNCTHWLWPEPENLKTGKTVEWWSEAHWKLLTDAGRLLRRNGDNVMYTPLINSKHPLIQVVRSKDGKFIFDYSRFDRWAETFYGLGFKYLAGHHLTQQNKRLYVKSEVTGKLERFSPETDWFGFLDVFLKDFNNHLKEKGIQDRYLQFIYDEPAVNKIDVYRKYADIFKRCMPETKSIDAINSKPELFDELVDIVVFNFTGICTRQKLVEQREKEQLAVWLYHCTSPYPPYPNRQLDRQLTECRLWPWLCNKFNATGFLFWAANLYRGVPDEYKTSLGPLPNGSQNPGHPPGDAWFYYRTADGLISSLRIVSFREGMTDATLWEMLQKVKPEAAAAFMNKLIFPEITQGLRKPWSEYLKLADSASPGYETAPEKYHQVRAGMLEILDNE